MKTRINILLLFSFFVAILLSYGCKNEPVTVPDTEKDIPSVGGPSEPPPGVTPPAQEPAGPLKLAVTATTSNAVNISWTPLANAISTKVYVSPEPSNGEILEATPENSASSYEVKDLAAGVDVFIKVESETSSEKVTDLVHAKTIGGPRADLKNALREVHAMSPNILQIVIKDGDGESWQGGSWIVQRSDGSEIGIKDKWRHTIPVSADDFSRRSDDPHFYEIKSDKVTAIDHRIYLVLNEAIGNCEWLTITGPNGLSFRLPFSDKYLETPGIQVNQVGYNPRATRRWAYVSAWLGDGLALSLETFPATASVLKEPANEIFPREVVLSDLNISVRSAFDADAGTEVKDIDLSLLSAAEGVYYRVHIPGVGVSWRTAVSEKAAFQAYYVLMRGLFFNRWAGDLKPELTYWSRLQDHTNNVFTTDVLSDPDEKFCNIDCPPATDSNKRKLIGGYHDAGDFDQRPMHTVVPQLLMRAYELNPTVYKDNELNIPESGNKIPDLLDEAMWGVAAWQQLQDDDGGVRMGVETYRHPLYSFANYDALPYWTYTKDAGTSARAAGLFAQASRLIYEFDKDKAAELRTAAEKAYIYAEENKASYHYMFYAAGELLRLTGDLKYKDYFESTWKKIVGECSAFPRFSNCHLSQSDYMTVKDRDKDPIEMQDRAMPDFFLGYYKSEITPATCQELYGTVDSEWATQTIRSRVDTVLKVEADGVVNDTINSSHAHRNPRQYPVMDWGRGTSVSRVLDTAVAMLQTGRLTPGEKIRYFDALSLAADYVLGCNPNGFAYVSGLGSRHPMEPLHHDSLIFTKEGKGPMPGIPVYGPIKEPSGNDYMKPTQDAFYPAPFDFQPPGLRYADTRPFVNGNEFSVWEMQGPLAQLFAILYVPLP